MNEQKPLKGSRPPHIERIYVKVNSDFDSTGYIQPKSITWKDGRTFKIDAVKDYRPASVYRKGVEGACYTVMIKGEEKHLFFEWMAEKNPYADIIHLPHHQAANRPHMSMLNRAAQFSPYAALVGFDGVIAETGRLTDQKIELSETEKELIDQKLTLIDETIRDGQHPKITVWYFMQDAHKKGGSYQEYTGPVRNIDIFKRTIVFLAENGRSKGKIVMIDDVLEIQGELFDYLDWT